MSADGNGSDIAGALESIGAYGSSMPFSLEEVGVDMKAIRAIIRTIRKNKPEYQEFFKDACAAMNGIFCQDNSCEDPDCHRCFPDPECYLLPNGHEKCGDDSKNDG